MNKLFFVLIIGILVFFKAGIDKICSHLEDVDGTMQQVHMELYKLRMGAEEEWSKTI